MNSLRIDERGTASVEAVIIIPVLAFLLAAVLWINRSSVTVINSRAEARSCAWRHSQNNCDPALLPPDCEGLVNPAPQREIQTGDPINAAVSGIEKAADGGDYQGIIASVVGTILMPAINEALNNATEATITKSEMKPPLMGGAEVTFKTHYRLACNLKPRDPMNIASMTWEEFKP